MKRISAPVAIEAHDVHFAYPDGITALDGVSFRAHEGEFVAVMGANGSGKTTLLKILMRLLQPQRGEVRLAAADIRHLRPAELYRRVGMVFQNPADQLFAASVEEDVAFGPRNLGLSEAEVAARVEQSPWPPSTPSTCGIGRSIISATANRNASAWRACWPCGRRCCCWTSRPPAWTPPAKRR